MIRSGESASPISHTEAARDAVKTYVRLNREELAADGELLGLLLPERFDGEVCDLQRHVIDKLAAENAMLRRERDALKGFRDRSATLSECVRRAVLDFVAAGSFAEVVAAAIGAASAFGADRCAFCVECLEAVPAGWAWLRPIAQGTIGAVVGDGLGAILSGGGELLFGPDGVDCRSLAAFRLRLPNGLPPVLYVLGSLAEGGFEGRETESNLRFFAQAMERAMRAKLDDKWPDLPKI